MLVTFLKSSTGAYRLGADPQPGYTDLRAKWQLMEMISLHPTWFGSNLAYPGAATGERQVVAGSGYRLRSRSYPSSFMTPLLLKSRHPAMNPISLLWAKAA